MRFDTKIKRLIEKYGVKGYGIYNYILECIAFRLEPNKPVPEIEEESQDIARELKMDAAEAQEIIEFCIHEKLFEINPDTHRIMCLNLLKHLDNTLSNNPEIKNILSNFNKLEASSSNLKQIRLDKNRLDKNKEREIPERNIIPPTCEMVKKYCDERKNGIDPNQFIDHYNARGWKPKGYTQKMTDWQSAVRTWERGNKNIVNEKSLEDRKAEIQKIMSD